jgi:hypothetical protein
MIGKGMIQAVKLPWNITKGLVFSLEKVRFKNFRKTSFRLVMDSKQHLISYLGKKTTTSKE